MKDRFNREVDYLRISVTDLCNLRCTYCMGEDGVNKVSHKSILTPERIRNIVKEASELGIHKVRITGGEPLVRHGIIEICRYIANVPGIDEVCITTNGVLLDKYAKDLYDAGVRKLNISLDTLNKDKYRKITRLGNIDDVLTGIKKAKEVGFKDIKINAVLIGGFNDDEIVNFKDFALQNNLTIRFIELMPIGESLGFNDKSFMSNNIILEKLGNLEFEKVDGVSLLYKLNDKGAKIGLISPLSNSFCKNCSRLRLTSEGKLRPCLHSSLEVDTNGFDGDELKEVIKKAILLKPESHHLNEGKKTNDKKMHQIGG